VNYFTDPKRAEALLDVVREVLPRSVESDGDFEDWNLIAPALVWTVADFYEGIASVEPPRGRIRGEALARSAAEYAIYFAWLAGPDEGRDGRIRTLLKDEFRQRVKVENRLKDHMLRQPQYEAMIERGLFPKTIFDEGSLERKAPVLEDATIPQLPHALEAAFAADLEWMPRLAQVEQYPYAFIHFTTFTSSSSTTHPSVTGIDRVITGGGGQLLVGTPAPFEQATGPYGGGYLALLNTLWVASQALGWPDPAAIEAAVR
jgi:hypothetical protein